MLRKCHYDHIDSDTTEQKTFLVQDQISEVEPDAKNESGGGRGEKFVLVRLLLRNESPGYLFCLVKLAYKWRPISVTQSNRLALNKQNEMR